MKLRTTKNKAVAIFALIITLSGCGKGESSNSNDISAYQATLISRANFLVINDQAAIDYENSYSTAFGQDGVVLGDSNGKNFINWGLSKSVTPSACAFEGFWNTSTSDIAESKKIVGLASNLHTSELSLENFQRTRASILGQYTIVFRDEETTSKYFSAISGNLKVCATGVIGKDSDGELFEIFKEGPKRNFKFYSSGTDVLLRTGFDDLLVLDFFVKTRFSITLVKIFVNDLNLPKFEDWSIFEPLIQVSVNQICMLETCEPAIISLNSLEPYDPNPSLAETPILN